MKKKIVSCNTCNTENFGLYAPPQADKLLKAFCLTANGYPTTNGFTKRTYILEYEEDLDKAVPTRV